MASTPLSFSPTVPLPNGLVAPKLHHLSGEPVRAAICNANLFEPIAVGPGRRVRAPVRQQLDPRLWCLPGVYCLLWDPGKNPTEVYVGSSNDLLARLQSHEREDWTHAVLLTGHGMGRSGAEQAERALGRVLKAPQPCRRITPTWEAHPSAWGADMPWHLFAPLVVLLDLCLRELNIAVSLDPQVARR
jgi:hypothetical protein